MQYIHFKAAQVYLNISKDSYFLGFIDWGTFLDRLVVLKDLSQENTVIRKYAKNILTMEEWSSDINWSEEENLKPSGLKDHENSNSNICSKIEPDDDPYCLMLILNISGLKQWTFHPFDDDFFPSIPHGHGERKSQSKLDPYLGWVYKGSTQNRREPRINIVKLWNDDQFRRMALTAIEYYTSKHSHYNGWRVKNTLRLPRKR